MPTSEGLGRRDHPGLEQDFFDCTTELTGAVERCFSARAWRTDYYVWFSVNVLDFNLVAKSDQSQSESEARQA